MTTQTATKHTPTIGFGKDRYGHFLMIDGFRAAMPSAEVAQMLAASQELLEALEMAIYYYESFRDSSPVGDTERDDIASARAAIRKATGE